MRLKQEICHRVKVRDRGMSKRDYLTANGLEIDWIDQARKQREIEGEVKYGKISPKTDQRCFVQEMTEELLDALNYCQWAREKGEIGFNLCRVADGSIRFILSLFKNGSSYDESRRSQIKPVLSLQSLGTRRGALSYPSHGSGRVDSEESL